jgi:hypothetical protein
MSAFTLLAPARRSQGSTRADGSHWTACPYEKLLKNALALKALLREARAIVAEVVRTGKADRKLMARMGAAIEVLAGCKDPAFAVSLPAVGALVAIYQALCPLYEEWLGDGDGGSALSTVFLAALQRASGLVLVLCNTSFVCWCKGAHGTEKARGAAGCHCDYSAGLLEVLADVRELHMLCLEAARVKIVGVIAASKDAIASFVGKAASTVALGELLEDYRRPLFALQHPKFAFVASSNDGSVCERLKIHKGDRVRRSSAVAELYAQTAVHVRELIDGEVLRVEDVYELVRKDPLTRKSGYVVRPWASRHETTSDAETTERLDAADFARRSKGGRNGKGVSKCFSTRKTLTHEHIDVGLQYLNGAVVYARTATGGKYSNRLQIGVKKLEEMSKHVPADAPMLALIASVRDKKPAKFPPRIPGGIKVGAVGKHAIWSAGLKIVSVEIKGTPKAAKPKVPGKPKVHKAKRKARKA